MSSTPESGRRAVTARFLRFAGVGVVAGLVDMGVVQLLVQGLGGNLYLSRVVSYLCAATVAWWLNRNFTFGHRRSPALLKEWARYLVANLAGGLVNLGVYAALVATVPLLARYPFIAVGFGSLAGLLVNFTVSSRLVFTTRRGA